MEYNTHVYLGPTLDVVTAKKYLAQAHYHPPIKCGDLIRLLRLNPKRVIIIDGIYETTPAVWHKEILLLLDLGIEVFGAASMGALRAAELHPFGMVGIGEIFQCFANQTLNDDDEVAVLHRSSFDNFSPINDALVNIRATLAQAYQQGIITHKVQNALIDYCKKQFYAHRSLKKAIQAMEIQYPNDCRLLTDWLSQYGLIDLKKKDAEQVLIHVNELGSASSFEPLRPATTPLSPATAPLRPATAPLRPATAPLRPAACPQDPEILLNAPSPCINQDPTGSRSQAAGRRDLKCEQPQTITSENKVVAKMPVTKFIASLVDEAVFQPFDFQAEWLPDIEKQLQTFSVKYPARFKWIQELGKLTKYLYSVTEKPFPPQQLDIFLTQIQTNHWYSPENDFSFLKHHPILCDAYALLCQLICVGQITERMIQTYLPALQVYVQHHSDPLSAPPSKILRLMLVLIFCIHSQLADNRLKMKESWIRAHLKDIDFWTHLKQILTNTKTLNAHTIVAARPSSRGACDEGSLVELEMTSEQLHTIIELISIYMQITYVHYGFRDIHLGTPSTPTDFHWIYYAYDFYQQTCLD